MIEVQSLSKNYGTIKAVSDISFEVKKGEILGFLGPNGAGKTTTMRMLTGFLQPTEGTVRIAGDDVFEKPMDVKRNIGYLPENAPNYGYMSVKAYLNFMAEVKGVKRKERKERVAKVMRQCQIEDVQNRLIDHLSKGYRQRVGIAQAIVHDPKVLVLDEPTIGLDPKQIIQVRNMIKGLKESHTIILSTHILPEVGMTCDRALIINKGKLVAMDTPENLSGQLRQANKIYVEVKGPKNAEELKDKLKSLPAVTSVKPENSGYLVETGKDADVRAQLAGLLVGAGWQLLELRLVTLSLEEIFLQLITKESVQ